MHMAKARIFKGVSGTFNVVRVCIYGNRVQKLYIKLF